MQHCKLFTIPNVYEHPFVIWIVHIFWFTSNEFATCVLYSIGCVESTEREIEQMVRIQ